VIICSALFSFKADIKSISTSGLTLLSLAIPAGWILGDSLEPNMAGMVNWEEFDFSEGLLEPR